MADPSAPLRVAFVGAEVAIDACILHAPAGGFSPALVDFRADDDARELAAALDVVAPDVVVVFAPSRLPQALLSGLPATKLYVATEPDEEPPDGYDAVVSWMLPLPVDDRMFADVRPWQDPPRALFLGASTEYRERFLVDAKHRHDLLHYAHGLWGDDLRRVFARVDVGVNVHAAGQPTFEHRVLLHLAAGHLVLSEALEPAFGLRADTDYVPIASSHDLLRILGELEERPERYGGIRASGRAAVEAHRASRVWPVLLRDLLAARR
jgi:hypothetical protein